MPCQTCQAHGLSGEGHNTSTCKIKKAEAFVIKKTCGAVAGAIGGAAGAHVGHPHVGAHLGAVAGARVGKVVAVHVLKTDAQKAYAKRKH